MAPKRPAIKATASAPTTSSTPPRRSPRKPVKSAKKIESEAVVQVTEMAKKKKAPPPPATKMKRPPKRPPLPAVQLHVFSPDRFVTSPEEISPAMARATEITPAAPSSRVQPVVWTATPNSRACVGKVYGAKQRAQASESEPRTHSNEAENPTVLRVVQNRAASPIKPLPAFGTGPDLLGQGTAREQRPHYDDFLQRFKGNDAYGEQLRYREQLAYSTTRGDVSENVAAALVPAHDPYVDLAQERGAARARFEMQIRADGRNDDDERVRPSRPRKSPCPPQNDNSSSTASSPATPPVPLTQPSAKGRGTVRSTTNPEFIPGTGYKNPFFETMPGPEVWHRHMPPYFPFGDTPRTAQAMSDQIHRDLENGAEKLKASGGILSRATEGVKSTINAVGSVFGAPSDKAVLGHGSGKGREERCPPAWALPDVEDWEIDLVKTSMKKRAADAQPSPQRPMKRSRNVDREEDRIGRSL